VTSNAGTKSCPDCGETISSVARVCHYCQHRFGLLARISRAAPTVLAVATVLLAAASAVIAVVSLRESDKTAATQQTLEKRTEEETAAPILVPQIPGNERVVVHVPVHFPDSTVTKGSDVLYLDRDAYGHGRGRFVMPIANDGPGGT
jgi:Uncharacterised protein family UPF0547